MLRSKPTLAQLRKLAKAKGWTLGSIEEAYTTGEKPGWMWMHLRVVKDTRDHCADFGGRLEMVIESARCFISALPDAPKTRKANR